MFPLRRLSRFRFFWQYKRTLKNSTVKPNTSIAAGGGLVMRVDLYDVLDNKEIGKLIRKIAKLNRKGFQAKLYYKRSGLRGRNYIRPQFDHTATGLFADINPPDDNLISKINLSWTQINNDEAVMQYSFTLRKPIRSVNDCRDGILEHWALLMNMKVLPFYKSVDILTTEHNQSVQYIYNLFLSIFQGFVSKNLYTRLGHTYQLPVNVLQLTKKKSAMDKIIKDGFLYSLYKKDDADIYIGHGVVDQWQTDTFFIGDKYSGGDLLGYFSQYGMDYYYSIFHDIEVAELSKRLVGYFNKEKTKISLRSRKWLLKKFRRASEIKLFSTTPMRQSGVFGVTKDVLGSDYIRAGLADRFKYVYEDNLKYIDSVFGLVDVHIWARVLLAVSILTLAATVAALFK